MNKIMISLIISLMLAVVATSVSAVGCGDTISTNTVLSNDLIDCAGHGIIIGASGITLDCAGHTIDGVDLTTAVGVRIRHMNGVTVRNCVITDFHTGVYNFYSPNAVIDNVVASSNLMGVSMGYSEGTTLSNNDFSDNRNYGIIVQGSGWDLDNIDIVNNIADDNPSAGIYLNDVRGSTLTNNHIDGSGAWVSYGIMVSFSPGNTLTGNTVTNTNQYGIRLYSSPDNILNSNTVEDNVDMGIAVQQGSTNTQLTGNSACGHNSDVIVDASSGGSGSGNTCSNAVNYNDDLEVGCTYTCTVIVDNDGDGSPAGVDCDDGDADIYPGAPEICDTKDNQCPGDVGYGEIDTDGGLSCDCFKGDIQDCPMDTGVCEGVQQECDASSGQWLDCDFGPDYQSAEHSLVGGECKDFLDNDCDGYIDFADIGCDAPEIWSAYPFDYDARDMTINGRDGTVQGAVIVPGKNKGAFFFDGNDRILLHPYTTADFGMHGNAGFIVHMWIKPDIPISWNSPGYFFGMGQPHDVRGIAIGPARNNPNALRLTMGPLNTKTVPAPGLFDGDWHHVLVFYDPGIDHMIVYYDDFEPEYAEVDDFYMADDSLSIGSRYHQYYKGLIDEVVFMPYSAGWTSPLWEFNTIRRIFGSSGGTIESVGNKVSIDIPTGALSMDAMLTITKLDAPASPYPDFKLQSDDGTYIYPISDYYQIGPDGLQFDVPVTITWDLVLDPVPANWDTMVSDVYLYDEVTDSYVDKGDCTNHGSEGVYLNTVCVAVTEHLSKYVVADKDFDNDGVLSGYDCDDSDASVTSCTYLEVEALKHTVGSGSYPGSTKEPLVGLEVSVYDKSSGSCVQSYGVSWQNYLDIVANCLPEDTRVINSDGFAYFSIASGDYLVIGDEGTDKHLGVSVGDLLVDTTTRKYLQQIIKADGSKLPGKTTKKAGSEILIVEPEYVEWDSTQEAYPFIFMSEDSWGVDVSIAPPEGYEADYEVLTETTPEYKVVQFMITEVGSVPDETKVHMKLRDPKGRSQVHRSAIGTRLHANLAKAKGVAIDKNGVVLGRGKAVGITGAVISELGQGSVLVGVIVLAVVISLFFFMRKESGKQKKVVTRKKITKKKSSKRKRRS